MYTNMVILKVLAIVPSLKLLYSKLVKCHTSSPKIKTFRESFKVVQLCSELLLYDRMHSRGFWDDVTLPNYAQITSDFT